MGELLKTMSTFTGLARTDVLQITRTAPRRYKTYNIEKRSGGLREIAQPARELKALQYALMEAYLSGLPVHSAAAAYRPGKSILDNAKKHVGSSPILKMDFKDFFPSVHAVDWKRYCIKHSVLDAEDIDLSSNILFRKAKREKTLKLSIGAPSSPMLSNILMFSFDEYMAKEAEKREISYTRYADDLTFSGQRMGLLRDMAMMVPKAVREVRGPKLRLNHDKTRFVSPKFQRNVTGLVLGNEGEVGIGRVKLRLLRARVHHAINHELNDKERLSLAGYLSFVKDVDPASLQKIVKKFGEEDIRNLMRYGSTL